MPLRTKTSIEDEVMFRSDRKCVVCQNPGHHIHHIDGNKSNNAFDNLAFRCFPHHDVATIKGGLSRKLSAGQIRKFRALHYERVAHHRKLKFDQNHRILKNVDFLYELCRDAMVSIEVGKLKTKLSGSDWELTDNTLMDFYAFPPDIGVRARQAMLEAVEEISSETRDNMPINIVYSIASVATYVIPTKGKRETMNEKELVLYELGVITGFNVAYGGIKYLDSGKHALRGLKLIYRVSRYAGFNRKVMNIAIREIDSLLELSKSHSRMARLINVYRQAIVTKETDYPILPDEFDDIF